MKIIGLKNCDKCRKALKELTALGFTPELSDIREQPLSSEQISEILTTFGDKALNTRSTTWRGLDEETRQKPAQTLLESYPTLMKRPLIRLDGEMRLGWDVAAFAYFKDKA